MAEVVQLAEYIFKVSGILTSDESAKLIERSEELGYSPATVNSPLGPAVVASNIRNNDRVILDDDDLAAELWEKVNPFCPKYYKGHRAIGLNERLRFYRYGPKHVFRWHRDGSYRRENGEFSCLTLMFYLNDGFSGGETQFDDLTIEPEAGMALLFAHGYLHEGGEVLDGCKYVLRTDVMFSAEPEGLDDLDS